MYCLSFEAWCTRILSGPGGGGTALPRKCRPAPAQTASVHPLLPRSLGSRSNTGGRMGLRRSDLATWDATRRPTRPTHASISSKPPPSRPLGRRAPCRWDHPGAPPLPSRPLGSLLLHPVPPRPGANAAAPLRAPATDGEMPAAAVPPGPQLPRAPAPVSVLQWDAEGWGSTCWDGSPGGGSSKSIMLSWGWCSEAPRRRSCPGCPSSARTGRRRRRRLVRAPRHSLLGDKALAAR
ncbi:cell death-inducing p53-target protein 1-like [Desmodus rotundus]|uniref:cell death-inducing p53-target protein 1-like n=1 Tax=Desmodus rotundus TaxID=9430 RepID=UPI0039E6FF55